MNFLIQILLYSESVSIKQFSGDDDIIIIEVLVPENEMGSVIGREGKNINALRTIVQASSYLKENKTIKINVSSF